jgi:peptide/nickel transport system substrate-binding protein
LHPDFFVPNGEDVLSGGGGGTNIARLNDPKIGEFIDQMAGTAPGSEASVQLVQDFLKYWTENMYFISAIGFKKFVTWDERYWTGFPTAESPDYMPLYWFQAGKFAIQNHKPVSA